MTDATTRRSKVGRLVEEYGLDGYGERLERRWTADEDGASLRELATEFNQRLLAEAIHGDGTHPLDGEVANLYRLLVDDDVSSGSRVEARQRLEREGVDVDALTDDFVSHQAIHTYLRKVRGAEPPEQEERSRAERGRETIQRLGSKLEAVAETTLSDLDDEVLTVGDADVSVTVRVYCADCDSYATVEELFERGGCDCRD